MRGRGWGRVLALVLAATVLSVVRSSVLIFLPFALLLIALPPRRPLFVLAGVALLALLMTGRSVDPVTDFGRGWSLVLGAWFVVGVVVMRSASFMTRALFAVAGASVTTAALLALHPDSFATLDQAIASRLRAGVSAALQLGGRLSPSSEMTDALYRTAELQSTLYPALLGLASLAGLGVAWWAFRGIASRDRDALRPLAEFRFHDALIWVLILGGALLVLPIDGAAAGRTGSNLLAFMALLYALRGAAVLLFVGGMPGPIGLAIAAVAVVLLYPLVMATTFLVGLSDTWLDLRTRRKAGADADD
ncbi:MAG: YybS family protein [Gemmatimonadetes bacterium]|nr:YybS family protein [Gemmatimonadota bacterium]